MVSLDFDSGAWLPAVVRVTNTGDTAIRHDGDTKNWPYGLPTSTVLDLTGLNDPGSAWDGNAGRFKQRFLESQTIARLIMEQQPSDDGDEFPDYGVRPRMRPRASFELPVVAVPRYVWRDQPLPAGTASVDATFCFRRPSAEAGRREVCLRTSAPVTIEGEPVEYPGPAEIVDAVLRDPEFRSWVESRRPNVAFGINVAGIFPGDPEVTFFDLGYMGGPAPDETIEIRAGGGGPSPGSASVELDPWDVSVSVAPSGSPAVLIDWGPLAVIDDDAEGGLDAAGGTSRIIIEEECAFLRSAEGFRTTLIWRSGQTAWDLASRQIVFRDRDLGEVRLSHRDNVAIGGAALGEGPYAAPVWLAVPDATCPTPAWVVNQIDFIDE